jgi:hypothetical protein
MNLDEDGKPYAVLVGKDGQEVDQVAGEGVVEILREREEDEGEDYRPRFDLRRLMRYRP